MQFIYGLVTALGVELTGPSLCLDQEDHWIISTRYVRNVGFQAAHSLRTDPYLATFADFSFTEICRWLSRLSVAIATVGSCRAYLVAVAPIS